MIPKIIWQTHNYEYRDLPSHILKCLKTWKNVNPDWEHKYIDHLEREEFVFNESKDLYELYKKSKPVAQSDIWRILVVYKNGGVYADMDSVCIKPLSYMLNKYSGEDFISTSRGNNVFVNNAHFAAIKESQTLKKIINSMINDEIKDIDWHTFMCFNKHMKNKKAELFDAEVHSGDLKKRFAEFDIDFYGKKISYRQFLKQHLKISEEDYILSIDTSSGYF